jgi:integrase/recombinase XerD
VTEATTVELPLQAEDFLLHLVVEKGRSPLTISAYRRDLRRYQLFLAERGVVITGATARDVDDFATSLRAAGLAPSSTTRTLVAVRAMYRWLVAEELLDLDPTLSLETPKLPRPLPKALSEEQVLALLGAVEARVESDRDPLALRDLALLELLYGTGARISEVCGLGFGDVDLDGALVRLFGKRSKERIVPLGRPAIRALAVWFDEGRPALAPVAWRSRDDADAVFLGARGSRLTRQGAWLVLQRWARAVGLADQVSPHVMRHSCATHLLDHGADIRSVQELLGHASVSTTQIYTRVATERLWQAYRDAHPRSGVSG